jgi:Phosphopantetheine attachment site/AMP-binding enzyme C-terminal domain
VVAVPYADRPGHRALAGFVTPIGSASPAPERLRRYLRGLLPAHMVPATLCCLTRFPLTRNGKIDRDALLATASGSGVENAAEPPPAEWGPLERLLATLWSRELGASVGAHDDFFERGGDSLQATNVLNRLRDIFEGESLPMRSLFTESTVTAMARSLRGAETSPGRLDTIAQVSLEVDRLPAEQVEKALRERSPHTETGGLR